MTAQLLLDFATKNQRLGYLKSRWLDEKEYEDFSEYRTEIRKVFEAEGYQVGKISKSFKIILHKDGFKFQLSFGARKISLLTWAPKAAA